VTLDWDPNEHKRQRERERYATMSDENRSEINKKRRHVDLDNNMVAHSTGMVLLSVTLIAICVITNNNLCYV
jgi:hypothetical protein